MKTFQDVLARWPSLEAVAADTGRPIEAVRKWKQRDSIPGPDWANLVAGAKARGIRGVSVERLAQIAAREITPPHALPEARAS